MAAAVIIANVIKLSKNGMYFLAWNIRSHFGFEIKSKIGNVTTKNIEMLLLSDENIYNAIKSFRCSLKLSAGT